MYDIAIIGRGPAGVSAAINALQRNKKVIVFGDVSKKITSSPHISNYPGFITVTGENLAETLESHLNSVGPDINQKRVLAVYSLGDSFSIQAETEMIEAKSVILAVGVDFKKSIENEDRFLGSGVSYCATCDAPLYKDKITCVIGYNEEAYEEANFLSEICSKVFFVPMHKKEFKFNDNVEVINDVPVKFVGTMSCDTLVLKGTEVKAHGFFVIKDSLPLTSLVPGLTTEGPHVVVNRNMETNIDGLYAAGDITGKPYQIAKAVGEGQVAVLNAVEFLSKSK